MTATGWTGTLWLRTTSCAGRFPGRGEHDAATHVASAPFGVGRLLLRTRAVGPRGVCRRGSSALLRRKCIGDTRRAHFALLIRAGRSPPGTGSTARAAERIFRSEGAPAALWPFRAAPAPALMREDRAQRRRQPLARLPDPSQGHLQSSGATPAGGGRFGWPAGTDDPSCTACRREGPT